MADTPVLFRGRVLGVQVKEKRMKERDGDTVYERVERIGRITLEFLADTTDVQALAELIGEEPIYLGFSGQQLKMEGIK